MKEISAGGVVFRKHGNALQVQMIQDRYGKITLPKGKMEPGETVEETALREILEETGIVGTIVAPLKQISYQYALPGVGTIDKEVYYFLVEATGGQLQAQIEEIRGVEWLDPLEAWHQQKQAGYGNNDTVLLTALQSLGYEVN
ncbi:NUDIX hydrolase [Paenibacillus xerothermodurans]|uniref:NUDIX domain-containing protein n=1 Tax=Paenibacillus xerothermodurans TaxID=1977292 RepID=A0A2W1NT81_PAEXE|nr:NUDIX domain-containing protein [Paenibacillus xerothermodurans]PZE22715.1 NUDIX domain-containing protein [Paenibacillus xerothermodurans]